MKKIFKYIIVLILVGFSLSVIFYVYWPFANKFINYKTVTGDALFHVANIVSVQRNLVFPLLSWRPEYGGYPLVEGYPLIHNYLIQPFLAEFKSFLVVDYYASVFLLFYFISAFILLFYVSRNIFLALLFTLVLIYGADAHMSLTVNAFFNFAAVQFSLPLILFITIIARKKNSIRLFFLSAVVLAITFYSHGSFTGFVIIPMLLPFLIFDNKGKISKESILRAIKYFLIFASISIFQIYSFIDYSNQGYLGGIKMYELKIIPERFLNIMSWVNPVFLPLLIIFIPLFIIAMRRNFSRLIPYILSLLLVIVMFTLGLFNITSLNIVLLVERVLVGTSLSFLLLFSAVISVLVGTNKMKQVTVGLFSFALGAVYLYLTLIVNLPHLVPDTVRSVDQYYYKGKPEAAKTKEQVKEYLTKYDFIKDIRRLPWNQRFDNYRTDGLSWAVYTGWPIWSSQTRYKGRFPMAKGLPLDWQGLVTAAEYGTLGEAGSQDKSQWAINQSIFFFDWYGIKHLEIGIGEPIVAEFLTKKPYITSVDKIENINYYNFDKKYISPMYAPVNAKTMAVIAPEIEYANFIGTISYSEFTSKKLITIFLGSSLNSLNKNNLKYFDSVFLYGYDEGLFGSGQTWSLLSDYVKAGGKLIIETGKKVRQTETFSPPDVFPVKQTAMEVVTSPFNVDVEVNELTQGVASSDFNPLKTKYLPYALSEAPEGSLKEWAKPVLEVNGRALLAFGQYGQGEVVWSGLNLPFHAIDNRNTSETVIFANILNWFFPSEEESIENFKINYPNPEKIILSSSQGKGFLVKENYNPGWVATLNGKRTNIYKAGLMQMYVPFDSEGGEQTLELNFYGNPLHWMLFLVSVLSLLMVLFYILFNKNPLNWIKRLPKSKKIKIPTLNFKQEEEDY